MITNAEFVSRVINGVNATTKDDHISRRYILSIGRNKATTYIAQKLTDRTLQRESKLFQTINCFELEKIDKVKCDIVEFRRCDILMKSKLPIPSVVSSRYGEAILLVTSVDGMVEFDYSSISDIKRNSQREFGHLVQNYYIHNNYMYIPNYEVEAVDIDILTLQQKEAVEANSCKKCDKCKSVWDYEFICPDRLLDAIVRETIQEIFGKKSIPVDEQPNLDSNIKSQIRN